MAERFSTEFQQLIQFQNEVAHFHPAFEGAYPIAIAEDEKFYIYDRPDNKGEYQLMKTTPVPIPIPEGMMAAFPLAAYGGVVVAAVTPAIFDRPDWRVMFLHEFVHCYQDKTGSNNLREQLSICQEEEARGHITWEIDHPFPYTDEAFVTTYTGFLQALEAGNAEAVSGFRKDLHKILSSRDFEYMVWEEWVEGFARWNENRLREYAKLPRLDFGAAPPYNRVTFYVGGAAYIDLIVSERPELNTDLPALFHRMMQPG